MFDRRIFLAFALSVAATGLAPALAADKPRVLLLGDSISIGYTPYVESMLKDEMVVLRPTRPNGTAENCSGTTDGLKHIDRWLAIDGGKWDVIHFNWGLHDMKREDPATKQASPNPDHPRQADLATYEAQLRQLVIKLKATNAKLIFATTTPVPAGGVKPHRDVTDPAAYNAAALKVMTEHGVAVNDLYTFANDRLQEIQRPVNVHFTGAGSKLLAEQVVKSIRQTLGR